jgi:hypothetical protein
MTNQQRKKCIAIARKLFLCDRKIDSVGILSVINTKKYYIKLIYSNRYGNKLKKREKSKDEI